MTSPLSGLACVSTLAVVIGAAVTAQEPAPAARYRALAREYQSAQQFYYKALQTAKTSTERRQAEALLPKPEDYAARFLELARASPTDPAALDALNWILTYSPHGPQAERALELLASNQLQDKRLTSVLQRLGTSRLPAAENLLRAALDKSPHREIRAQACYSLATLLAAKERGTAGPKSPAKPGVKRKKDEPEQPADHQAESAREEAAKLFDRLAQEYGDVKVSRKKTYGELARANLARMRPGSGKTTASSTLATASGSSEVGLEIGMVALEIHGLDTGGEPMRLRDYRGKVVVLDFWGHW
jgi:hypothetical protein